ncbi:MAG: O-antigen ligase family protein [Verrucomicrobiae bacterium]|nr:O-antigen ligase family protein [Verrucomicrobiae bacterium]
MEKVLSGAMAALICGAMVFAIVFFGAVHAWFAMPVWGVGLLLWILLAAGLLVGQGFTRALWMDAAALAFVLVAVFGWFRSPNEFQSRQEALNVIACGAAFFSVRFLLHRNWHLQAVCAVFLLVMIGESISAIYQHYAEVKMVLWRPQVYLGRSSGTWICPNHFAGMLALAMPLTLSLVLWSHLHPSWRILGAYGLTVMAVGIMFAYSRAGQVAAVVGMAVSLWLGIRRKGLATLLVVFTVALVVLGAVFYVRENVPEQVGRYTAPTDIRVRIQMWTSAWKIFLDHPVFGVGPMMFDAWHGHHREGLISRAVYAHNDYLHLLADYGIVGGGVMAAALVLLARRFLLGGRKYDLFVSLRHPHGEILPDRVAFQRAAFIGIAGGCAGVLTHLLLDFDMHILANALAVSTLVGFLVSLSFRAEEWDARQRPWPTAARLGLAVAGFAAAALLAPLVLRTFYSELWRERAVQADKALEWPAAETAFRRALAADPKNSAALGDYAEYLYRRAQLGVLQRDQWGARFLEACARALEANPLNQNLRVRRGEVLDLLGRPEEAEKDYLEALRFDPGNPFFHNRIGLHYQRRGMAERAAAHFQRVIQLHGDDVARENLKVLKPL